MGCSLCPAASLTVDDKSASGDVVAMIRPESIRIAALDAAKLSGHVDRVSFIGDRQRLTVSGAAQRPLVIDAPNTLDVKVGERIGLMVDPRAVRVLPEERS